MSVPLSICLESLKPLKQTPKGLTSIKLLRKILSNVVAKPEEEKYRKLNAAKLMPKLAAENLAPIYIIEHAGFIKKDTKYILPQDADIGKISALVVQVEEVLNLGSSGSGTGAGSAPSQYAGLTQKQIDELEWEKEKKRLEETAERNQRLRDARRAEERRKREEEEAKEAARKKKEEAENKEDGKQTMDQDNALATNTTAASSTGGGDDMEQEEVKDSSATAESSGAASMEVEKKSEKKEATLDVTQFPPKSSLDAKMGKTNGETTVVNEDGKAMAYQWQDGSWNLVGEAVAAKPKRDADLDDEMQQIVKNLKAGKSAAGPGTKKAKKSKKPANFASMTLEEKHAYAVKERQKKERELQKQRERNRREVGRAQAHLSEQSEWQKLKAAAALKRKQEKAARIAKKKLLARMKRERAQKNKEIAEENKRLLAEQAERRRQMMSGGKK